MGEAIASPTSKISPLDQKASSSSRKKQHRNDSHEIASFKIKQRKNMKWLIFTFSLYTCSNLYVVVDLYMLGCIHFLYFYFLYTIYTFLCKRRGLLSVSVQKQIYIQDPRKNLCKRRTLSVSLQKRIYIQDPRKIKIHIKDPSTKDDKRTSTDTNLM